SVWPFVNTPFYLWSDSMLPEDDLLTPFIIDERPRFSGTWIIGPPDTGKTTLLNAMFHDDLKKVAKNQASIVLLDSKGDLTDEVRNLKVFAHGQPLYGKLVIIDPDPDHPLALNPLDIGENLEGLTYGQRKMLANRSVKLLEYLFATLVEDAVMSGPQTRLFNGCMKAILEVYPEPTLHTLKDLLIKGYEHPNHAKYIVQLDDEDRDFFSKDQFGGATLKATKESLLTKLGNLLDNYAIASMFKAPKSRLDLAKEMDGAKIILINNKKALLEDDGAEFFGRYFLYLLRKAAERRPTKGPHMPVYVYMDEAHNVIKRDENIATIVQECRSKQIAMIFAHQSISQIQSERVKSALADCGVIMAN
ncbi:MAG TPA: TraM recognition domain-containing protein, partial [Rhabdochlamydiaceae bacterium]